MVDQSFVDMNVIARPVLWAEAIYLLIQIASLRLQ